MSAVSGATDGAGVNVCIQTALPWGSETGPLEHSDDWCSPPELLVPVLRYIDARGETAIGLDPCSNRYSVVPALEAWTIADDCLSRSPFEWAEHVTGYLNAPYSGPGPFLERFCDAVALGLDGVTLVKHDHSTAWWERLWERSLAVCLLSDRVRYLAGGTQRVQATFPSSVFLPNGPRTNLARFRRAFEPFGTIVGCV